MESEKERILQFDWLRVIAMIGVIVIHVFAKTSITSFTPSQKIAYDIWPELMGFAVPVFVMISGALILPKESDLKKTLKRCRRLLYALACFGLPAAILENIWQYKALSADILLKSVFDIISGNSWDVFWFVYMLIGVYLVLPIIRDGLQSKANAIYFAVILYVFLAIITAINGVRQTIGFYLPINSVYLLYAVLGHLIVNIMCADQRNKMILPLSVYLLVYIVLLAFNFICGWGYEKILTSYPLKVIYALSVFVISFRFLNRPSKIITMLSKYSFGVYLIHCYYNNFIYKFLHILPVEFPLIISIPILVAAVLCFSVVTSAVLFKIPVFRKHII